MTPRDRGPARATREIAREAPPFLADALLGLRARPKWLPCKYFYDGRGSALFERICDLDEYYLTRSELSIMTAHAAEMADALGPACLVVELGSGSSRKTRLLLDRLVAPAAYVPIDISPDALRDSVAQLGDEYPFLSVVAVCADYTQPFDVPVVRRPVARRVVYFPGSTIGNFSRDEARAFVGRMSELVGPGGAILLGVDLRKDRAIVEPAYNDATGVTAAFNLNLLHRLNGEVGASFRVDRFEHRAFYDEAEGRIEMQLVSRIAQSAALGSEIVRFEAGEAIVTEHSHKYGLDEIHALASSGGLRVEQMWTDDRNLFAVALLSTVG